MDEDAGKVVARVHKGAHKTNSQKNGLVHKRNSSHICFEFESFNFLVKYVILVNYRFNIKMYS